MVNIADLKKEFEADKELKGHVVTADDGSLHANIPYYISTRVPTLDFALTRPGVPGGRLTSIIGPEGGGKSTLVANIIAETQARGGVALLHDTENRFSQERAATLGVKLEDLLMLQHTSLEKSLNAAQKLFESVRAVSQDCPILYVVDSVAGAVTDARMKAEAGDSIPAEVARVLSLNLGRLHGEAARHGATMVFVNQLRTRINMGDPRLVGMPARQKVMGQQDTMVGERAMLYWSSVVLWVNQISLVGEKDDPTGIRVRATVKKCSIGPGENKKAEYEIDKLKGIDVVQSRFELLQDLGIIKTKGAWYQLDPAVFGETKSFHRPDFPGVWDANPSLAQLVESAPLLWNPSKSEG